MCGAVVVLLRVTFMSSVCISLPQRLGCVRCASVGETRHSMASTVAQSVWLSTYAPHSTSITKQQVYRTCVQLVEALGGHCLRNTTLDGAVAWYGPRTVQKAVLASIALRPPGSAGNLISSQVAVPSCSNTAAACAAVRRDHAAVRMYCAASWAATMLRRRRLQCRQSACVACVCGMKADSLPAAQEINEKHEPPEPQCVSEATEFSETNQVAVCSPAPSP